MDKVVTSNKDKNTWFEKVGTLYLVVLFVTAPAFFLLAYLWTFHAAGISGDPERWGQFGDFLAGVLNPFVALLTVMILIRSLSQNQDVIDISREELIASRRALETTIEELKISRNIQVKTEEALNKQIELTILAEGYRYHHGLVHGAKETMIMTAEQSTKIANELMGFGINVYKSYNPKMCVNNEKELRARYLESIRVAGQAEDQFTSAKLMEREVGGVLAEQAFDLVRVYKERQANLPADACQRE